jgi:hypothetical protein
LAQDHAANQSVGSIPCLHCSVEKIRRVNGLKKNCNAKNNRSQPTRLVGRKRWSFILQKKMDGDGEQLRQFVRNAAKNSLLEQIVIKVVSTVARNAKTQLEGIKLKSPVDGARKILKQSLQMLELRKVGYHFVLRHVRM